MADRIIKGDSGNDVVIQNNAGSRKIEVTNSGDVEVTGDVKTTTVKATNLKANDGTAGLVVADSTGEVTSSGGLKATNVKTTNLKANDGTASIEVADSTGDIGFSGNTNLKIKLPSAGGIYESNGSTEILTESSGLVSLKNTNLNANNIFPEGVIIQVKTGTHSTESATSSTSFVATGISVPITPKSTSSKIFIICNTSGYNNGGSTQVGYYTIYRDSTDLGAGGVGFATIFQGSGAGDDLGTNICISELDSPNTTSQITYQMYVRSNSTSHNVSWSMNSAKSDITVMEVAG